jgi:hypothetical protein
MENWTRRQFTFPFFHVGFTHTIAITKSCFRVAEITTGAIQLAPAEYFHASTGGTDFGITVKIINDLLRRIRQITNMWISAIIKVNSAKWVSISENKSDMRGSTANIARLSSARIGWR